MSANDIPGYLQGFILSSANFSGGRFLDQSPYSGWDNNHLEITTGTPAYNTLNGEEGWAMDNTCQGYALCPNAWEGSVVLVAQPAIPVNANIYPVIFGAAASVASNGNIRMTRTSGTRRTSIRAVSAVSAADADYTTDDGQVVALSFSQQTRTTYATKDGSTIVTGSTVAAAPSGVFCMAGNTTNAAEGFRARYGNISGTIADFGVSSNTCTLYEIHYFKGNILLDSATELAAFMAELKTKYSL